MNIPKPVLKDCDETSLSLSWEGFSPGEKLFRGKFILMVISKNCKYSNILITTSHDNSKVQYKNAVAPWSDSKFFELPKAAEELKDITDLVDLEPGTAYGKVLLWFLEECFCIRKLTKIVV